MTAHRLELAAVAGALVVVLGSVLVLGPLPALVLVPAMVAAVVAIRFPVVAVLIPLVVAPVAFTAIPGTGGLRVIHIAVALAVGGVVLGYLTGRLRVRPPAVLGWGVGFVGAWALASMTSIDPVQSLQSSLNHVLGLALAAAAAVVVRQSAAALDWLLRGWVLAASVVIVPALPAALSATDRFAGALIEGRAQGVFSQPNDFGEYSMYAVVMAWALFTAARHRGDRVLAGIGGLLGAAGVAVSFSRGTWLGLVVMMVAAMALSPRLVKPVITVLVALSPVFIVSIATGTPPFAALSERLTAFFAGAPNPEDDRTVIHEQAWRLFAEHPWTGTGPGTYAQGAFDPGAELIRRPYLHAHTVLLTAASELGVVGVLTLLALTVALAVVVLRARRILRATGEVRTNARLAVMAAGLVGIAVHGLVDCVYTNPYLVPLAWLQVGLVAGLCARVTDSSRLDRASVAVAA